MKVPLLIEIIEALLFAGAGVLVVALFRAWLRKRRNQP